MCYFVDQFITNSSNQSLLFYLMNKWDNLNGFFAFISDLLSALGSQFTWVGYFVQCVWRTVLLCHHWRWILTQEKPWYTFWNFNIRAHLSLQQRRNRFHHRQVKTEKNKKGALFCPTLLLAFNLHSSLFRCFLKWANSFLIRKTVKKKIKSQKRKCLKYGPKLKTCPATYPQLNQS